MKLGILVRSESRGLGSLSLEYWEHLRPDKTLVVVPAGVRKHGLTSNLDWYPGAEHVRYDGNLNERICREWLDGLDAVLSFESFYDWRFCHWARQANVATVCMAMPEWCRPQWAGYPTQWWAPTTWRLDRLPQGTRHVPVPVPVPPVPFPVREPGPFRWLHVGGARLPDEQMNADRNGTLAVLKAAHRLKVPQTVTVRTQSPVPPAEGVTVIHDSVADRWDLYRDADALVLPRRYAGLSLPVLEAFGAGLPVVMTDMNPQNVDWPVQTVHTQPGTPLKLLGGLIETGDADPRALAGMMDRWASDPDEVDRWRQKSRDYAKRTSWEHGRLAILAELERAANLATV